MRHSTDPLLVALVPLFDRSKLVRLRSATRERAKPDLLVSKRCDSSFNSMPIALLLIAVGLLAQWGNAQVPQINLPLVPAAATPGASGFTLTINGTGFTPSSVVNWNGSPRTTTFVSNTRITAKITAADIASPTTALVKVVAAGSPESNAEYFEVTTATSSVSFGKADYATESTPYFATTADLNGDGKLDILVPNFKSNTVSIFLGNGDGTFQVPLNYATGSFPTSVTLGDFNDDRKLDFAVTNQFSNNVNIFLGNGDGTFQSAGTYGVGSWPVNGAAGDFNGDSKLDLVITDFNDNTVMVLLGNGNGTFQPPVTYTAGSGPARVEVGDFNRDGNLDLLVDNQNGGNVSVLLGNGDGTFQGAVNSATGIGPSSLSVADLNGDGKLDVVVAHGETTNLVSVLLGNGDGTFQAPVDYAADAGTWWTTVGDFNGDGKPDLAVANGTGNTVSVLVGNGDGTFLPPTNYAVGTQPFGIIGGDFNGDGRMDLAVANSLSDTVSILLQSNPVTYSAEIQPPIASDGTSVFKANRGVVPVKFTLELSGVSTCDLPQASISLIEVSGASPGPVNQNEFEVASDNGTAFRISSCQYVYNLGTSNLGSGSYKVQITVSGSVVGSGTFGLQ